MPDVKDIYESVTRQAPPQREPLPRQHSRQRRYVRNRRIGAIGVTVVLILGLAWVARPTADRRAPAPAATTSVPPLPLLADGAYLLDVESGEVEPAGHVDGGFAWSPSPTDPGRYAFSKGDETGEVQVWVESVDELRQLTNLPGAYGPVWSPDGRWLAVSAGWSFSSPGPPQIYVIEVDSGRVSRLTDEPLGASAPTWSPDGTSIMYGARQRGVVVDGLPFLPEYWILRQVELEVDGNRVAAQGATTIIGDQAAPAEMPSWASDRPLIAFVRIASPTRFTATPASLWLLDLDSGLTRELVPELPGLVDPRFSPDDRTISFKVEGADGWEAWVVDVDSGETSRLSRGYPFGWADPDHVHIDVSAS